MIRKTHIACFSSYLYISNTKQTIFDIKVLVGKKETTIFQSLRDLTVLFTFEVAIFHNKHVAQMNRIVHSLSPVI